MTNPLLSTAMDPVTIDGRTIERAVTLTVSGPRASGKTMLLREISEWLKRFDIKVLVDDPLRAANLRQPLRGTCDAFDGGTLVVVLKEEAVSDKALEVLAEAAYPGERGGLPAWDALTDDNSFHAALRAEAFRKALIRHNVG